ncbi:MAG TPA: YbhB/YbcL family Raf kinase inhibitor-like protein [Candidatus Acidoferrales bacterium]|nr:YbhB/YbcL family Raf kinase inhibitor-like protein [Candidatus Acidoferrales bacterium]
MQIVRAIPRTALIAGVVLMLATGVGKSTPAYGQFVLSSTAIAPNAPIARDYSCSGADVSPPLSWSGAPTSAKSFALIVEDPDAPGGTFIHWVAYNIPAARTSMPQGVARGGQIDGGGRSGMNDFGHFGYNGPCPPPGSVHHYHFRLFALDSTLNLGEKVDAAALEAAINGHVVASAELIGTFSR